MLIKSKLSICGIVNMKPGEIKDIPEKTARQLIKVGYAEKMIQDVPVATTQLEQDEPLLPEQDEPLLPEQDEPLLSEQDEPKTPAKRGRKKVEDK